MIDIKNTQLHTFYDVVHCAQSKTSIYLNISVESYVVYMLMRGLNKQISDESISIRYLNAIVDNCTSSTIKIIADDSLLLSGIKNNRDYADIASSAYEYVFMKTDNDVYKYMAQNSILVYTILCSVFDISK